MSTPEARAAYLEAACAGDAALYRKVEELLKEHFSNDSLLAGPAVQDGRSEVQSQQAQAPMLDRYKLLEKIGEGGFGEVWMAEQREPIKRRVAIKIIKPGMDSRQIVARFEAERQALAMMDHANIARIFDAGVTDSGRPYFVMELVRGMKITDYCDQNQLPTRERLNLFILVCQAIQHAHQKGIIHRDIKPSNILVTLHDGVPVPKVIDFGIAKATHQELTDKTLFTQFQHFIGTPAYISPEQAEMSGLDIDTRADIYSLGVLLYELLVGQTPFDAKEMMQGGLDALRQIIREKEPLRPSTKLNTLSSDARTTAGKRRQTDVARLVHQLRGDLDWIVMKCLEKDRTRRYETTNGLATDIQRYLANEPVTARPPSAAYKLQKAWQRNKVVFTAGAVVAVALLAGIGVSTWQAVVATGARRVAVYAQKAAETARQEAESSRQQESALRARAESAERATQQQLYIALLEQARATMVSGEMGHRVRALDALRRAAAISNSVEVRREVIVALALPDLRFERELSFGADATYAYLDPSFERLALGRGREPVEIRAVSDNRLLATLPASTNLPTYGKLWSADGRFLAVKRDYPDGGRHADWEVWEVASQKRVLLLRNVVADVFSFHPRLPRVIAKITSEAVATWNLENGRQLTRFPRAGAAVRLSFSPKGDRFAALVWPGGKFEVHDATNPEAPALVSRPRPFEGSINGMTWHPDGRSLVVPDSGGAIHWVDAQTGESELLGRHKSSARSAVFSPNAAYLFTGGWEREIVCWDARTKHRLFTADLNGNRFQFSADGRHWALNGETSVQLHTFEQRTAYREFAEDLGIGVRWGTISPNGRWLAASGDKRIGVWDLSGGGPGALETNGYRVDLSFTADGQEMLGSPREGTSACIRWRLSPPTNAAAPPVLTRLPLRIPKGLTSLSPVSNSMVMTSSEGSQILAPEENGQDSRRWVPTSPGINGVSPDGRWLGIRRPYGKSLYVYRLPHLEEVAKLTHPVSFGQFQFSPRGEEVAIGSFSDGSLVTFWNTTTWQRTRTLTNFCRVLYTPDAGTLWLHKDWHDAGLYDARTIEALLLLPKGMLPLALSPDGLHLAVSVDARRLQVWDLSEIRKQLHTLGLDWVD
ncbi:MAG TPA: WD40 repeat domain-containing serine/threonine protein kinase [Verrucomicrobiae bacterium]|nr:WD40 repeat domain-containing serine/threonine protein kinase [Verrucomicrobiae bacterium]